MALSDIQAVTSPLIHYEILDRMEVEKLLFIKTQPKRLHSFVSRRFSTP